MKADPREQTDTCENITFPQLRLRAVKMFLLQITVTRLLNVMLPISTQTDHERERTRVGFFVNVASSVGVCFW